MANAGHCGPPNARTLGFEQSLGNSVGSVSRNFSVSPTAGAQLTVALIECRCPTRRRSFTYPEDNALMAFTEGIELRPMGELTTFVEAVLW